MKAMAKEIEVSLCEVIHMGAFHTPVEVGFILTFVLGLMVAILCCVPQLYKWPSLLLAH